MQTAKQIMRFIGSIVAAIAVAFALPAARAQAQSVTLTPSPEGLVAVYQLPSPVNRFVFAAPRVVRGDWTAGTPGTALDGESVSADVAFDRFSLLIRPDSTEAGRGYIALVRIGEGYVLYGPALTGEGAALALDATLPAGWILTPSEDASGYVYIGPERAVQSLPSGARTIAAADLSTPLRDTAFGVFADATAFYTARFGPPAKTPVLAVTTQGAGPASFRGDVTDTGVISARFNGNSWAAPDSDALSQVVRFVFHETGHEWNSHSARPLESSPWLHEGGAEYMALVGAISTDWITEAEARDSLSGRLTGCRRAAGSRPDAATRMVSGSAVYDCGTVIQWLADMELRRDSHGQRSVLDVWANLIGRFRQGQVEYGPVDFRAALSPDSAVSFFFDGPADERWAMLEQRLSALGVRWENRPSAHDYVVAALFHLNAVNCGAGASTGFYVRDGGYIEMDNDQTCGALSGPVALGSIEALNPLEQSQAMFEAVQERCADSLPIRITLRSGEAITLACSKPLPTPTAYAVTTVPELGL